MLERVLEAVICAFSPNEAGIIAVLSMAVFLPFDSLCLLSQQTGFHVCFRFVLRRGFGLRFRFLFALNSQAFSAFAFKLRFRFAFGFRFRFRNSLFEIRFQIRFHSGGLAFAFAFDCKTKTLRKLSFFGCVACKFLKNFLFENTITPRFLEF